MKYKDDFLTDIKADLKLFDRILKELSALDSYNLNVRDYLSHFKFQIFLARFS